MVTEPEVDLEIESENLHAAQVMYFACMLEESRLFQVVDRIVELFRVGLLPMGARPAAERLAAVRETSRPSDAERRNLYQRVFGAPCGEGGPAPNREFNELWMRFLASVAALARSRSPAQGPRELAITSARRAARDLASNLSRSGYGLTQYAAAQLARSIEEVMHILEDDALLSAFGARDRWSLIERINADQFAFPIDARRYRTQAEAGSAILGWLAKQGAILKSDGQAGAIDEELIAACEHWLSASGLPAGIIEHYAEASGISPASRVDGLRAILCRFLNPLRAAFTRRSGRSPVRPSPGR